MGGVLGREVCVPGGWGGWEDMHGMRVGVFYCPRSEASEGYVFTGVCHSVIFGGGRWATPMATSPPGPGQNIYPLPPGTRSEHLPPPHPGPGQNIYPPPRTRSEHLPPLPGPGQKMYPLPPWDQVRTSTPPPEDQVRTSTPSPPIPGV